MPTSVYSSNVFAYILLRKHGSICYGWGATHALVSVMYVFLYTQCMLINLHFSPSVVRKVALNSLVYLFYF